MKIDATTLARKTSKELLAIYNAFPGVTQVNKFTSRAIATKRILAHYATLRASKAASPTTQPRETKKSTVLALCATKAGATIDQLMLATGWQRHTVRGFLSIAKVPRIDSGAYRAAA